MQGPVGVLHRAFHARLLDCRQDLPEQRTRDLIERLQLVPGPLFRKILAAVEEARMEGAVEDADGALQLARSLAAAQGCGPGGSDK